MSTTEMDTLTTLHEYLRARRAACGERVPREQVTLWRMQWATDVRNAANRREALDLRVARSYLRVFGGDAVRDLRGAANAEEFRL